MPSTVQPTAGVGHVVNTVSFSKRMQATIMECITTCDAIGHGWASILPTYICNVMEM